MTEIVSSYPIGEAFDLVRGDSFDSADWGSKAGTLDTLANRLVQDGIYSRKSLLFPRHLRDSLESKGFHVGFPMTQTQLLSGDDAGSPGYQWMRGLVDASRPTQEEGDGVPGDQLPSLVLDPDLARRSENPDYEDPEKFVGAGLVTADGLADQLRLKGVLRKKFINSLEQADRQKSLSSVQIGEVSIADPESWWITKLMTELTVGVTFLPTFMAGSAETIGTDLENWALNSRSPIPGEGNSPEEKEVLSAIDGVWAINSLNSAKYPKTSMAQSIVPTRGDVKRIREQSAASVAKEIGTAFDMVGRISRRTGIPFADIMKALRDAERASGGDEEKLFDYIRGYVNSQWRVTAPEGQNLPPNMIGKSDTERRILAEMFEEDPRKFGSRAGIITKGGMRSESEDLRIAKEVEMRLERYNQANIMKMAEEGALGPALQASPNSALGLYGDVMGVYKEGMYGSAFLKFLELQAEYMATEMPVNTAKAVAAIIGYGASWGGGVKPYETPSEWDKFVQDGQDMFRDHPGLTIIDLWGMSGLGGKALKGALMAPEAMMWAMFPSLNGLKKSIQDGVSADKLLAAEILGAKPGVAERISDRVPEAPYAPELPQLMGSGPAPLLARATDYALRASSMGRDALAGGRDALVGGGRALLSGDTYSGAYDAISGGISHAGRVALATALPDPKMASRYAKEAHDAAPRPTEMPTGPSHPRGFSDRTRLMEWKRDRKGRPSKDNELLAELDKLDTSIMPYSWTVELASLLRNRADAFSKQKEIMQGSRDGSKTGKAANEFRESVHEGVVYDIKLREKMSELHSALEERFLVADLESSATNKSKELHRENVSAAREEGRVVVDTDTGLPLAPEDPMDPRKAASDRRGDVDIEAVITTPVLEQGAAIRTAAERRGQNNNAVASAVDEISSEVSRVDSPRNMLARSRRDEVKDDLAVEGVTDALNLVGDAVSAERVSGWLGEARDSLYLYEDSKGVIHEVVDPSKATIKDDWTLLPRTETRGGPTASERIFGDATIVERGRNRKWFRTTDPPDPTTTRITSGEPGQQPGVFRESLPIFDLGQRRSVGAPTLDVEIRRIDGGVEVTARHSEGRPGDTLFRSVFEFGKGGVTRENLTLYIRRGVLAQYMKSIAGRAKKTQERIENTGVEPTGYLYDPSIGISADKILSVANQMKNMDVFSPIGDIQKMFIDEGFVAGETPSTPAQLSLKEFRAAREAGGGDKFLVDPVAVVGEDVARSLDMAEARIALEKGFVNLSEATNIPDNAGVLDVADLAAYRANLTPQMRASELVARGLGDFATFEYMSSRRTWDTAGDWADWGAYPDTSQYLAWRAMKNRSGGKGAVDYASEYNKALTDAATRDGLTPVQWLVKNSREQRAESMIRAGISDASIYEQIGFSAAEASSLALSGNTLHPKPVTIPKTPFSAAKVVAGTTPAKAKRKISEESAKNIRETESALSGRESRTAGYAPSFEADVRPMWHRIASVFLDRSGLDIISGHKKSPYETGSKRANIYALSEFMERPFAFVKAPVTLLDFAGNRLRKKYEGRVDSADGLSGFWDNVIWFFSGPSAKLGYTNFHELATAGRVGGILNERISPVLRELAGENVTFTNKDIQLLTEALDAPFKDTGYAGQYASDGWQIVGASDKQFIFTDKYANRVVDATKRWEKEFIIEDANGNKTRLTDFADKYANFEGRRITVDALQDMVRFGEITIQRAQRGVRGFEYRHKEGMQWSDLTDQQKSILLIANRLTAPLDTAFFDSAIQLATSPEGMRLTLGSGDVARLDPLLNASKANIIKMASNWMSDFYDPRGAFSFLVDTLHKMAKTGIDPSSLDGPGGTAAGMDVMLGRVAPGGGTREISISTIRKYPNHFTTKRLKKRLEDWNIGPITEELDGIGVLPASRERLLQLQPELGLSEIVELWNSPTSGAAFRKQFGVGGGPPAVVERYYNSRIWDKYLTYDEKIEWGLWDLREAASKASLDMGSALAHQKLIVGMRESGMLLTHSEWHSLKRDAAKDAEAVFGRDSSGARLSAERMQRLHDQYVNPGEGFADIGGPKVWDELSNEFVIHKAIRKHIYEQAKMFESMKSGLSRAHQNIKLGLVFDPIGGTLLRNYFSNRWMMGLMADIPWNQRHNKSANRMIKDFYERGIIDPLYMEIRQNGYGKATAAATEFQTAEAFMKMDLQMSEMSAGLTDGLLEAGVSPEKVQRFGDMLWYGAGATKARRAKKSRVIGEGIAPEEAFLRQLRMHEQRSPLGDWTGRGGLEGTRTASTADRIGRKASEAKRWMVEEYGIIDDTAKLSYILQLVKDHHYSVKEAIKAADKAFMAYDDVAPMINLLRNNASGAILSSPFIVFAAKAASKALEFMADHPGRGFVATNLLQAYSHAVSAMINYDKEEILSLMLDDNKVLLPTIGSQETLRRRGSRSRSVDPGKLIGERDLSLMESGPKAVDIGLWQFWWRQLADGERGARQVDSPLLKSLAMISAFTGGTAPWGEVMANAMHPHRAKKIDRELEEEGFRNPADSTIESFTRHAAKVFDPVLPSAYRSGAKLASAILGESVGGQRGKMVERVSTFTGVKETIVDRNKALLDAERNVEFALNALIKEYHSLNDDRLDWTRENSGEAFPQQDRLNDLKWVYENSKHIKRGIKSEKNAKIILNYREWLPKMYTLLEDVDGMALNSALLRIQKGAERSDLSERERRAFDSHEQRESMQKALRGIGAIAQEIGIGGSGEAAIPYLFEEAAGGPQ
tara:strand:+ start:454 stop:8685 length:8232 start_codon:yes stop_codon:yes gene_type:complete